MSSFDFVVLVRLRDGDFVIGPHSFEFGEEREFEIFVQFWSDLKSTLDETIETAYGQTEKNINVIKDWIEDKNKRVLILLDGYDESNDNGWRTVLHDKLTWSYRSIRNEDTNNSHKCKHGVGRLDAHTQNGRTHRK